MNGKVGVTRKTSVLSYNRQLIGLIKAQKPMDNKPNPQSESDPGNQPVQQSLFDDFVAGEVDGNKQPSEPIEFQLVEADATPTTEAKTRTVDDAATRQILISLLACSSLKGIGFKTICDAFDSGFLLDVWLNENKIHNHPFLAGKNRADLVQLTTIPKPQLQKLVEPRLEDLQRDNISFTTIGDPDYPESLKKLKDPPRWLFIQGNTELLHSSSIVAVIGTRDASDEGKALAYEISRNLARQNVIVLSGLAKGIDEVAHRGCVDYYGQTIAVLGHGISFHRLSRAALTLREQIVRRGGAIVSEYLPSDPPSNRSYLRRNELQVALSKVVIPVEFPSLNSGTGATIRRAKNLHVPVVGFF
jgi:DNA protecting protein DprA